MIRCSTIRTSCSNSSVLAARFLTKGTQLAANRDVGGGFYRKFYSDLANFPIAPGLHTQVIRIKDNTSVPDPVYQWHYRPEYQFSRFELEMKDIERQYTDEAGEWVRLLAIKRLARYIFTQRIELSSAYLTNLCD